MKRRLGSGERRLLNCSLGLTRNLAARIAMTRNLAARLAIKRKMGRFQSHRGLCAQDANAKDQCMQRGSLWPDWREIADGILSEAEDVLDRVKLMSDDECDDEPADEPAEDEAMSDGGRLTPEQWTKILNEEHDPGSSFKPPAAAARGHPRR